MEEEEEAVVVVERVYACEQIVVKRLHLMVEKCSMDEKKKEKASVERKKWSCVEEAE